MQWLILSLLTALAVASQDAWVKKNFSHLSAFDMLAFPFFFSFPLFMAVLPFVPVPPLDKTFYWCFLLSLPLNFVPFLIYMKAIQISPLSLTLPFLAFTPAFMIFTGYFLLGEMPNFWGKLGILITCAGGYVINLERGRRSVLAPLSAAFRETGSWLMLIVAFLFSFSAVVGKQAILHSSPLFFSMTFFTALTFFSLVILLTVGKIRMATFVVSWKKGLIAGMLFFVHVLLHSFAIAVTKAAYMISVKRLSGLIGIVYGGLFFKEEHIVIRLMGAVLMVVGAVLITVFGK